MANLYFYWWLTPPQRYIFLIPLISNEILRRICALAQALRGEHMTFISTTAGYVFLFLFGAIMIAVTLVLRSKMTRESFLVSNRNAGWLLGGTSIAASWLWAPALFVSVQLAYEKGLAGIFWFTFPNVVALALFAVFAPTIREKMPKGYTLPQFIKKRLSKRVHRAYLVPYFFYQLMAVSVQLFAGGSLLMLLTGIPLTIVMPLLAGVALAYMLISGLRASMITDLVQMALILGIGAIILPLTWKAFGGIATISSGTRGLANVSIFDPGIALSFGIVTAIGLIAGALCDQQYWQRSFAIKKKELRKAFLFGAVLFAIVPLALATLGFIAASPTTTIQLPQGVDNAMIGVQTIATGMPNWATMLFVIMLLAGLTSTLDSGLSAASSLWATDIVHSRKAIRDARIAMLLISGAGLAIAYAVYYIPSFGLQHLWWIFNTIAACVAMPTILSLYAKRVSERGVFWGILITFLLGVPAFVYGNIIGSTAWIVGASLAIIATSSAASFA